MIEVNHLYKKYNSQKDKYAVEDFSITVKPGKITGLLGPNGSGKTTVLKTICGFHYPTKGIVKVSNVDICEHPEQAMKLIGYVPEISVLPDEMVVSKFLDYTSELHNVKDIQKQKDYVIKECGLEKIVNKKIKTLSKGQKQRVSFAQCLIYNPENLILDEPVSGLDPAQIQQLRVLIKKISETKAVLLSTHILQEIDALCDEIVILCNGKTVASGTAEQIIKQTGTNSLENSFIKLTKDNETNE